MQGADKNSVGGSVQRWNYTHGIEEVDAAKYIDMLEREVELLRDQQDQSQARLCPCCAVLVLSLCEIG